MVRALPSHKPRTCRMDQATTAGEIPAVAACVMCSREAGRASRQAFARFAAAKSQFSSLSISAFA
jgi:hypothetical protein